MNIVEVFQRLSLLETQSGLKPHEWANALVSTLLVTNGVKAGDDAEQLVRFFIREIKELAQKQKDNR